MKKTLLLLTLGSLFTTSCGPTPPSTEEVVSFNEQLVKAEKLCVLFEKEFLDVCQTLDTVQIRQTYHTFKSRIDSAAATMKNLKEVSEFASFRKCGTDLVARFTQMIGKEYLQYANFYCIPADKYTDEDEEKCVALAGKINAAIEPLVTKFTDEQEAFAKKWGLTLVDTPDSLVTKPRG